MDMFASGPRNSAQHDDGNRMATDSKEYINRGRNSPYRDRYQVDRRHSDDRYSPRRETYPQRNEGYRNRGDEDWSNSRKGESYGRRRSSGRSPRRYSPQRRDSRDYSPRGRSPTIGRNFFRRSRSRSYSRGRRRSSGRSPSPRGKGRYRRSRTPDNGYRSRKRSSSYDSPRRSRSSSSDSSRSSQGSSEHSNSHGRPKDDFFRSMYTQQEDNDSNYLHPVLDRGPKTKIQRAPMEMRAVENVTAQSLSHTESLSALSKNYNNSSPPKPHNVHEDMDDEDRFLYGDDGQVQSSDREGEREECAVEPQQPPLPSAPVPLQPPLPTQEQQNVTPGGFDSNALKNVLKAIGFDFEMSAKQTEAMNLKPDQTVIAAVTAAATQSVASLKSVQDQMHNAQPSNPQAKQFYQPYNPYSQGTSQQSIAEVAPTISGQVQDERTNPGYLIYQSVNAPAGQSKTTFTQHETSPNLTVIQPGTTLIKTEPVPSSGRMVLPPGSSVVPAESLVQNEEMKQSKLDYLQEELDKLKKQQNTLLRRKRREKDGHKDPLITKNTMLQAGVEEQIREIQQTTEESTWINNENLDEAQEKEDKYDYFDPGNHWCKLCNTVSHDLPDFLTHLHSKTHRKAIDPYDRPWNDLEPKKKKKAKDCTSKASKGSEFLIPITGYFCTICQTFSGDQICAEDHLKTYSHNAQYKKFCKQNKAYEKHQKKKKKEAKLLDANGKQEGNRESVEVVAKYVEKDLKTKKNKASKPAPEEKYRDEEYRKQDDKRNRGDSLHMETSHNDREREDNLLPRKYSGSGNDRRRKAEQDSPKKSGSRWSPGYDEYERQHQEHRYRTPEKKRRSSSRRSRSRSRERWVERDPIERKERKHQPRQHGFQPGNKISTPGFGKFSWNSGSKMNAQSSRFDQEHMVTQVDNQQAKDEIPDDRKGKIAIKITGKVNQPKLLTPTSLTKSKNPLDSAGKSISIQGKRAAMENELRRKVEALKKENALKAQLSSITLPSGRTAKQYQASPNTAAVILGTRNVGKSKWGAKPNNMVYTPPPLPQIKQVKPPPPEPPKAELDEANLVDVPVSPCRREAREPPPPGEEDITVVNEDGGAASDASGISMELASDED